VFDSVFLYSAQAVMIAGVLFLLVRRQAVVLRLQVLGWMVGVISIAARYGINGQMSFYSNDQAQYASGVRILMYEAWPRTLQWWLEVSKIPYPVAALPLAQLGIHHALALKTVSLACLLALTRELLQRNGDPKFIGQVKVLYLTGCGLIGSFFSLLALRETMMMYFVYRFATDRSLAGRIVSIIILFLLRSHLAAALLVAEAALAGWNWVTKKRRIGFFHAPTLIVLGVTLGTVLFSWRFSGIHGLTGLDEIRTPFSGSFGRKEVTEISSNFVGLQFLTVHEAFIRLSIAQLLGLRLIFSDTVIIPLGFTVVCLLLGHQSTNRHRFTLIAFATYVSIVTNTDFNSFRQNIPLMPMMGLVILDALEHLRQSQTVAQQQVTPLSAASRLAK